MSGIDALPKVGYKRGMNEPILTYLKRKLREAGPKRWPAIGELTGCSVHTMRKVAYNDIDNPGIVTMQPLLDLFYAVDRGERELPEIKVATAADDAVASSDGEAVACGFPAHD